MKRSYEEKYSSTSSHLGTLGTWVGSGGHVGEVDPDGDENGQLGKYQGWDGRDELSLIDLIAGDSSMATVVSINQ